MRSPRVRTVLVIQAVLPIKVCIFQQFMRQHTFLPSRQESSRLRSLSPRILSPWRLAVFSLAFFTGPQRQSKTFGLWRILTVKTDLGFRLHSCFGTPMGLLIASTLAFRPPDTRCKRSTKLLYPV